MMLFVLSRVAGASLTDLWPPVQQSPAFEQYLKRPSTELSKLIFLMDYFKNAEVKVVYDNNEYDSAEALRYAKKYLAKNYKSNENAAKWLKTHANRSQPGGKVIYFKFSDGRSSPILDLLLEKLTTLEQSASNA